jgi:hypothetical protein
MTIPVTARRNLDAYIPDTEIIVKIPAGTQGLIVDDLRNEIVLVNFNVPGLSALRVALSDLDMQDKFELLINQMQAVHGSDIEDKIAAYKDVDKILIRALQMVADESNRDKVEKLIAEYQKAIRWVDSRKDKKK